MPDPSKENGFGLKYDHYRFQNDDHSSKEWLIAVDTEQTCLHIFYGKMNQSMRYSRIPIADPFNLDSEKMNRSTSKIDSGYEYIGFASIHRSKVSMSETPVIHQQSTDFNYTLEYSTDSELHAKAIILSDLFQQYGFPIQTLETHIRIGDVKIYRKRPPRNSDAHGMLPMPGEATAALFLLMLSKQTTAVQLYDQNGVFCQSWSCFQYHEDAFSSQLVRFAEEQAIKARPLSSYQMASNSSFF